MAHILVIEDDAPVRALLQQMLVKAGYQVTVAADGARGVEVVGARPVDLVITDIFMPVKEGIETIIELGKTFPSIKIIAISGGGRTGKLDYLSIAENFGARRCLHKPFERHELLRAVHEVLGEDDRH